MSKIKIFRKVNSKCQIKGCRSNGRKVDTFYVSASEGYGPSAILCKDCIESLYERLNGVQMQSDDEKEAILAHNKLLQEENENLKEENKALSNLLRTPDADEETEVLVAEDDSEETTAQSADTDSSFVKDAEADEAVVLTIEEPAEGHETVDKTPDTTEVVKKTRSKKANA